MSKSLKRLLMYTAVILIASVGYTLYAFNTLPASKERETFLSEIGEGFGEVAMYALAFIYLRTLLKLFMGKGPLSKRLLPIYTPPPQASLFNKLIVYLDRTHVHVGLAAVALIIIHTALMGAPMRNLFFPAILLLVAWQTLFGLFLRWRKAPRNLKKVSFSVHAQLVTGVMMGVFAYFGHALVD